LIAFAVPIFYPAGAKLRGKEKAVEGFIGNEKLISGEKLRSYNQRTNLRGCLQTGSHLTAISLAAYALHNSWGSYWAALWFVVLGTLLNFLYAGQHELSHWTVFKARWPNNLFGHLFGFILLMPREHDRMEHYQHHRHTQDPDLDGELQGSPYFNTRSYLWYASGLGYWTGIIWRTFGTAFKLRFPAFFTPKQCLLSTLEARLYLFGYLLIALLSWYLQSWAVIAYWIAPMFATKFIHNCQNLAEHTGMPNESDIFINTRTIKSNALLNWLAWNMPYHTAHHTYPAVPFYKLPQLHAEMVAASGCEPETISYLSYQWHMLRKLRREGSSKYKGKPLSSY
jgi:fatty acid desaturase